ncbi:MAG: cupin domain-containing protein [Polyangiaceae bacterium]|jgi:predicted cupin superfamily sugar epimerase
MKQVTVCDGVGALIESLALAPHPEGGFYRETFRASLAVPTPNGDRCASTAIYFLLPAGSVSALHRVRSDEVWHHYDGDALELHTIDATTEAHAVTVLGPDWTKGERPQLVVPAGIWQAAVVRGPRYALCGCTVAPGFDFADFEMPSRSDLSARMPALRSVIERLARP